jgi:hypothetical protein
MHEPMPGFHVGTFDRYGSLAPASRRSRSDYAADGDTDDAQGIEHIFQVVRNLITGFTNPYDSHGILIRQDPRWVRAASFGSKRPNGSGVSGDTPAAAAAGNMIDSSLDPRLH